MHKLLHGTLFLSLIAFSPLFAETAADEKLFLEPHISSQTACFNTGINVSATKQLVTKDSFSVVGLATHLKEISAKLPQNGTAVITAPASYDIVFTRGTTSEADVKKQIDAAIANVGASSDPAVITAALNNLDSVARATFVVQEGKLALVTDAASLTPGQTVWRKNPEGARSEIFHSEEEYLVAIKDAGLVCEEIKRPCFFGEVKWKAYNASLSKSGDQATKALGSAYIQNNPFTIYHVVKKGA